MFIKFLAVFVIFVICTRPTDAGCNGCSITAADGPVQIERCIGCHISSCIDCSYGSRTSRDLALSSTAKKIDVCTGCLLDGCTQCFIGINEYPSK